MIQSAAFVINSSGHVVDFVVEPFLPADPATALQAAMRGESRATRLAVPLVSTGVHSGPIDLTVEVLRSRPEAIPPGWEDIHEVSLMIPEGRAYFNTPAAWETKDLSVLLSESEHGTSLPRFIKMWQGPPTATAHADPRLVTRDSQPE